MPYKRDWPAGKLTNAHALIRELTFWYKISELTAYVETSARKTLEKGKGNQFCWDSEMAENLITCLQSQFKSRIGVQDRRFRWRSTSSTLVIETGNVKAIRVTRAGPPTRAETFSCFTHEMKMSPGWLAPEGMGYNETSICGKILKYKNLRIFINVPGSNKPFG